MESKQEIIRHLQEAAKEQFMGIGELADLIQDYSLGGQIEHLSLLNSFVECIANPWWLHETPGYWLMRLDGTFAQEESIHKNNCLLEKLIVCETPFHVYYGEETLRFEARTSIMCFLHAQNGCCEGDRFITRGDVLTTGGWWPILQIVKNLPVSG